ncbi:MAG: hypothetical protein IT445_03795 [Phycisphaeraceae bacterium]|nr:hypothetical protein [Phycisphaeraceae bacterium]
MTKPSLQPTALLLHKLAESEHYDWLIARPDQDRLWTARLWQPSGQWRELGSFELIEIPPHRREYLTYQGPISGDRGHVQRIDAGTVRIESWNEKKATLQVAMRHFSGRIELCHIAGDRWRAQVG